MSYHAVRESVRGSTASALVAAFVNSWIRKRLRVAVL